MGLFKLKGPNKHGTTLESGILWGYHNSISTHPLNNLCLHPPSSPWKKISVHELYPAVVQIRRTLQPFVFTLQFWSVAVNWQRMTVKWYAYHNYKFQVRQLTRSSSGLLNIGLRCPAMQLNANALFFKY